MIAASVTSAARRPTPSARRRSPTPARAPGSTTIEYEWLPRLTETIMAPRRGARSRQGAANDGSWPARCRSRDRGGGGVPPEDRRGDEHDQFGGVVAVASLLEQPAEDRDVAEERDAADRLLALAVRHAADHQPLAFLDEHLGLRLALVDGGRLAAAGAEVDGGAPRVVLDQHAHLDAIDVPLADDGRRDLELEHRLLELDLGPGRADRRVRDFLAERDGGLVVLDGHDLRPGQRAGLALALQRFQREVEVQAAADDAERDPAVPADTTPGRIEPIGRFTRLPPFGRPVVALTGRIWPVPPPMVRFGFGSLPPRSLAPMPPVVSVLPTELVKPRPTSTPWLLFATPPPPHWMPSAKRSFRARISMRASIFTCGSGMSSFSRISVLIRSRSAA